MNLAKIRPFVGGASVIIGGTFMALVWDDAVRLEVSQLHDILMSWYYVLAVFAFVLMMVDERQTPVNGVVVAMYTLIGIGILGERQVPLRVILSFSFWAAILAVDFLKTWFWPFLNNEDPDDAP